MRNRSLLGVSVLGACALGASAFTGAWASPPSPLRNMIQPNARDVTFQGRVTVNNVLRVRKNTSVYGHAYAHNGLQVWQGLLVHTGGINADALIVSGPIQAQSANIAGIFQAGAINGASLSVGGAASVGGTLTANGKITGNGFDAGSGGLTTSGNITTSNLSAASVNDAGALNASSLTVTGNVNFSGATVTGLNLSGLNATGATLPSLAVGSSAATTAPISISANGHTTQIGVNSAGALSLGDLSTAGNVTVGGSGGVTASVLQGTPASGGSNPGPLSLQGSTISLAGDTTLANGSDLRLSVSGTSAGHIVAGSDVDVAGTVSIHVSDEQTTSTESTKSVTFAQPYDTVPTITLTPLADPDPGSSHAPKVWVTVTQGTGNYTGFTVHYVPSATSGSAHDIPFDYHVIG